MRGLADENWLKSGAGPRCALRDAARDKIGACLVVKSMLAIGKIVSAVGLDRVRGWIGRRLMPNFAYQARNQIGERVAGTRDAPDRHAALEALRELGLFVTQIVPAPASRGTRAADARAAQEAARTAAMHSATVEAGERILPRGATPEASGPRLAMSVAAQNAMTHAPNAVAQNAVAPSVAAAPSAAVPSNAQAGARTADQNVAPAPSTIPKAPPPAPTQMWARASAKEMSLFYRQMHAMLHAGTSLWHALQTMGEHEQNPRLRRAAREMALGLAQSKTWSQTMRAFPGLFSELAIGMVTAGEAGGFLDRMCLRLSQYAERDYELQQTIKRETAYPKMLVFCSILIPSVVPLVLSGFNAWLHAAVPPLLIVGGAFGCWKLMNFMMPVAAHTGSVRYWIDAIKLRLPVFGKTVRALSTTKFCRAMGALYAAGVGPHKAVIMAANACGNAVMAEKARRVAFDLENGMGLTEALSSTGEFPGVALQMMRTGEESGSLDEQLDKVADFLEADAETAIKQSVKAMGILVFLGIAAYIGSIVIHMWSGYGDQLTDIMKDE